MKALKNFLLMIMCCVLLGCQVPQPCRAINPAVAPEVKERSSKAEVSRKLRIKSTGKTKRAIRHASVETQNTYKQLDQIVDLSGLMPQMSFSDGIEELKNSVEPPLKIIVMWRDLEENAAIYRTTPINMDGISGVKLGTALRLLFKSVGNFAELGYAVKNRAIIIATKASLPKTFETLIYDVTNLTGRPADY